MEPRSRKDLVIAGCQAAQRAWAAALGGATEETLLLPGAAGGWSIKDIIAHVAADDRWFAGQLEALMRAELPTALSCYGDDVPPPPGTDMSSNDGRNAWHFARNRALPFATVKQLAADAAARRDAALDALPAAEFDALYTMADLGYVAHLRRARGEESGWPLWRAIEGNAAHHYADHTRDILAFLGRQSPSE